MNRKTTLSFLTAGLLLLTALAGPSAFAETRFVDAANGNNTNNGTTWNQAYKTLAYAIDQAHQMLSVTEIRVAKGTYYPEYKAGNGTSERHKAFTITRKGLELLGGYPTGGVGTRDPDAHPTILSGDLGTPDDNTDNAYHVLITVGSNIDASLKLDGFTVRDGNADGGADDFTSVNDFNFISKRRCGGWYNVQGSPHLNRMKITNNRSNFLGGGVLNEGGNPTVTSTTIFENASANGGGWYNYGGSPILKNVVIRRNSASAPGGGWFNNGGDPFVQNTLITGNAGSSSAWFNPSGNSSLLNCTVTANVGEPSISFLSGSMHIRNSIIWGPSVRDFNEMTKHISYTNSIVRGSGGSANWNNQLGTNNGGNLDKDPLFVDPATGDYRLQLCSPAINVGKTALITDHSIPDLDGNVRIIGANVDMGAYEYQLDTAPPAVIYVKPGGVGRGISWDCATSDLQAAITSAQDGDEVWVAGGTYQGSITMQEGVKIYGGFKGDEESRNERDLRNTTYTSILTGGMYVIDNDENGLNSKAVLDGFTITGGSKSGIRNRSASPSIVNCIIKGNSAGNSGEYGGGILNENSSSPTITNCVITGNRSKYGGGGIANINSASPILTNCTISGNSSPNGGGIHNQTSSSPVLRNSIVYRNNTGIYSDNGSGYTSYYSLVQDVTFMSDGNIAGYADPLFVDAGGGNYRLQACSPAINRGSNDYYREIRGQIPDLSNINTDLDGEVRIYNSTIDIGAYEFTGTPTAPVLAANEDEFIGQISGNTLFGTNGSVCTVIAHLSPNGSSPIAGEVTAKVWVKTTPQQNFVKRHYQITPASGAETATAKVTLYFTQQEFTDFNAENSVKLPINAADSDNYKANLRIEKRAGKSNNDSGLPGSYDGEIVTINPLDQAVNGSITWNADANRWEVSFDVTGFSGFFVKTTDTPLPLNLLSFKGTKENGVNLLTWQTAAEKDFSHFEVEYSANAKAFASVATVKGHQAGVYQFTHRSAPAPISYYRLRMVDTDGSFAYSRIVSLHGVDTGTTVGYLFPNPVKGITANLDVTVMEAANWETSVYTLIGTRLKHTTVALKPGRHQLTIDVAGLSSGIYIIRLSNNSRQEIIRKLVIE